MTHECYLVRIKELQARGKPWNGPCEVQRFIVGSDEARAHSLGKDIARRLTAATDSAFSFEVEALPYVRSGPAGQGDESTVLSIAAGIGDIEPRDMMAEGSFESADILSRFGNGELCESAAIAALEKRGWTQRRARVILEEHQNG